MAILVCAYLAAVFLCADARREGRADLADGFRRRALATAAVTGAMGLVGLLVLRADAPLLFAGLVGQGLPVIALSVLAGVVVVALLLTRRYQAARLASAAAVTTILVRWAVAQCPYVLPRTLTVEDTARGRAMLEALLVALNVGTLVLVPSLVFLYRLFQAPEHRTGRQPPEGTGTSSAS
ncbi:MULTISPECIES: cytochrome d ubiquinol oxidase subunit II [Pseudonocardia]|uniref:Cytochrome oxidase subunit II n=2 Tax=Pseudonocardia TaxID=1847 RepID=A0A1Y2MGX0_PSEAH|nr:MULTISPECIES: cytochrome d ubiquinol oxidase subunit II [Pseudonocardia]OSY34402.1 cytochrome oxidase subunit II [Pseudonocardia autotrophica]TDN76411.1 bd-type cytochrome oxidase subunit II [Pseudonocardia autotrophica]BBG00403.1 hypothetical protein Pdca_16120 [Pseudonocardia autotrophica]GEC28417.1 hypothetical protein PSA01_54460 [Pseudonocardia saturnea]